MDLNELIDLIKETKKAEDKNKEQLYTDWEIQAKNSNQEEKKYENSREGELLQELDETKDIGRRMELIAEIKKERESNLKDLNKKLNKELRTRIETLNKEIEARKTIIESNKQDLYRMKDNRDLLRAKGEKGEIPNWQNGYKSIQEEMRKKIKENGNLNNEIKDMQELLSILKNKDLDKLLEQFEKEKAESEQTQANSNSQNIESNKKNEDNKNTTKNDEETKWHSKLTKQQIEELKAEGIAPGDAEYYMALANYGIRDNQDKEEKQNEPSKADTVEEKDEKKSENNNKEDNKAQNNRSSENEEKQNDEVTENKEEAQTETQETEQGEILPTEDENKEQENKQEAQTETQEVAENNDISNDEPIVENDNNQIETIIITPDKVNVIGKETYELLTSAPTEQENILYERLSDETKNKVGQAINDENIKLDLSVLLGLLANEEQLNMYLELCKLESYKDMDTPEAKSAIEQWKQTEKLPKIQYALKGLRKLEISDEAKQNAYETAKQLKQTFKQFGIKDKVSIEIGILDRAYLTLKSIGKKFSALTNKKALSAGQKNVQNTEYLEPEVDMGELEYVQPEEVQFYREDDVEAGTTLENIPAEEQKLEPEDELSDEELMEIMKLIGKSKKEKTFKEELGGHKIDHEQAIKNAEQKGTTSPVQEQEKEN